MAALSGKAGTGKTLLALAAALQQNKAFEQFTCTSDRGLPNKVWVLPGINEKVSRHAAFV
ncbi:MAG: hypothetical protein ACLU4J_09825 [Butyricimonas paravirosa]